MATMYPPILPEQGHYESERIVLRAFEGLSDDFTIFYSFHWLLPRRKEKALREGEIDFVLLHPEFGLLVLEVKGGHEIRVEKEQYFRRYPGAKEWDLIPTNPEVQARTNMHALMDFLQNVAGVRKNIVSYGYAVVFPQTTRVKSVRAALPEIAIIDHHDLSASNLEERLLGIGEAFRNSDSPRITPSAVKTIVDAMAPRIQYLPAYGQMGKEEERKRLLLDRYQHQIYRSLMQNNRMIVSGGAGSGKTELAFSFAIELAQKGEQVLFLCYNTSLASYLQWRLERDAVFEDVRENLTIESVIRHCYSITADHPRRQIFDPTQETLIDQANACFYDPDWIDSPGPPSYDAILIDEAQDFRGAWIQDLEEWLEDPETGRLYLFLDNRQLLFVENVGIGQDFDDPQEDLMDWVQTNVWQNLVSNYRNPKHVAALASGVYNEKVECISTSPEQVEYVPIKLDFNQQKGQMLELIRKLIKSAKPSDIALLCPYANGGCLKNVSQIDGVKLVNNVDDWFNNRGILRTTQRSFKGLEATIVVIYGVTDIEGVSTDDHVVFRKSDMYVACSRTQLKLYVYTTRELIPRLKEMEVWALTEG